MVLVVPTVNCPQLSGGCVVLHAGSEQSPIAGEDEELGLSDDFGIVEVSGAGEGSLAKIDMVAGSSGDVIAGSAAGANVCVELDVGSVTVVCVRSSIDVKLDIELCP